MLNQSTFSLKFTRLSSEEIDMLLKNDSETYLNVINRFCRMPDQVKQLNLDFELVKSSKLNAYMIKQKAEMENFYSDDYYSAIMELENFLKSDVINPMQDIITIPPGNSIQEPGEDAEIDYYVAIALNNIWDIWWTYWTDGTRTKHKGAAGSFPG